MPTPARMLLLALVVCASLSSRAAHALMSTPSPYEDLVEQALTAYAAGDYEAAYKSFEAAHSHAPSARTHRGLGITALRAKRYTLAYYHLKAAMSDARRPLDEQLRETARQLLTTVEAEIARVRLAPDGLRVLLVDGSAPPHGLSDQELLLLPGRHLLTLQAADGSELTHALTVESGTEVQLDLNAELAERADEASVPALEKHQQAAAPKPPKAQPPARVKSVRPSTEPTPTRHDALPTGAIALLAVGGASMLGSAVMGALTQSTHQRLEQACDSDMRCDADLVRYRDRGVVLRTGTNVLLTVGGVALASGLLWWAVGAGAEALSLTPEVAVDRSGVQLQLRGRL